MIERCEKILVIKLSALGDFIQNLGLIRAIRNHHKNAHITLLTTKPYKKLAQASGYVDEIIIDPRPKFYQIAKWVKLKKSLNQKKFTTVYDLQINDRTSLYYSLLNPKPDWIGALKKQDRNKDGFAFNRHKNMIEHIGIKNISLDTLEWMKSDISHFNAKEKYALIVPGCAPSRPEKRWPALHYIKLCQSLITDGIQPVLIGTKDEEDILHQIADASDQILNLTGQTNFFDIAELARGAQLAIGNDTGPMHIIGPTGCPSLVLFSGASNPKKHAPMGQKIITLQENYIADITSEDVYNAIQSSLI